MKQEEKQMLRLAFKTETFSLAVAQRASETPNITDFCLRTAHAGTSPKSCRFPPSTCTMHFNSQCYQSLPYSHWTPVQLPKRQSSSLQLQNACATPKATDFFLTVTKRMCNSQSDRFLPYSYKSHVQLPKRQISSLQLQIACATPKATDFFPTVTGRMYNSQSNT